MSDNHLKISDEEKILSCWYADVPAPEGSTWIGPWFPQAGIEYQNGWSPTRYFDLRRTALAGGDIEVRLYGQQFPTGSEFRSISITVGDSREDLTPTQARALAAELIAVADAYE
jgi:hypothetical protein